MSSHNWSDFSDVASKWMQLLSCKANHTSSACCSLTCMSLRLSALLSCEPMNAFWPATLLGRGKEVIRFWWPWPHFQGLTSTFYCQICQRWCPCCSLSALYFFIACTSSYLFNHTLPDFYSFWGWILVATYAVTPTENRCLSLLVYWVCLGQPRRMVINV